jgi:hypothetical protein
VELEAENAALKLSLAKNMIRAGASAHRKVRGAGAALCREEGPMLVPGVTLCRDWHCRGSARRNLFPWDPMLLWAVACSGIAPRTAADLSAQNCWPHAQPRSHIHMQLLSVANQSFTASVMFLHLQPEKAGCDRGAGAQEPGL